VGLRLLEGDRRVPRVAYWRERKLPTITLRSSTRSAAPDGRYGMWFPALSRRPGGQPVTVYGDGEQRRCFCHVADTVDALVRMADAESAYGGVFNVAPGGGLDPRAGPPGHRSDRFGVGDRLCPYEEAYQEGFEDMARRIPT